MTEIIEDTTRDGRENDADDEDDSLVELAPTVPLRAIFRRFWPHTRGFRGRMVLSLLLTGAVPAISTASIYLYKVLIDDVLTPQDFRLRPDSDGYRAGPGGKDLGADVDLVGPGAAYERFRQSQAYGSWLRDSGQKVPEAH